MEEPIRTRKGKLAGRVEHDARLGRVVQVQKMGEEIRSFKLLAGKNFFLKINYPRTKKIGVRKRGGGNPLI